MLSDEQDLKSLSKNELVTELLQVMKERDQVIGRINMLTEEYAERSHLSRQQCTYVCMLMYMCVCIVG